MKLNQFNHIWFCICFICADDVFSFVGLYNCFCALYSLDVCIVSGQLGPFALINLIWFWFSCWLCWYNAEVGEYRRVDGGDGQPRGTDERPERHHPARVSVLTNPLARRRQSSLICIFWIAQCHQAQLTRPECGKGRVRKLPQIMQKLVFERLNRAVWYDSFTDWNRSCNIQIRDIRSHCFSSVLRIQESKWSYSYTEYE